MLECFENLIGIHKNCEPHTPTSGLFLNDLPGITLANIAAGVTAENSSYVDKIATLISEATNKVIHDFRTIIQPHMIYTSVLEADNIGFYKENQVAESASAGNYRGIRIKNNYRPSLSFNLNSFSLKLDASLTVPVYLYDLMTGAVLDTFSINTVAGKVAIKYVNKKYPNYGQNQQLALLYDAGVAGTYTTSASPYSGGSCSGCKGTYSNSYISFDGVSVSQAADVIDSNLTKLTGTAGLSINYSLDCDAGYYLCHIASLLADPIRHKTAELIFLDLQSPSPRINSVITVQAEEVKFFYQFYVGEYERITSPILNGWHPPHKDICFYCNRSLTKVVRIP